MHVNFHVALGASSNTEVYFITVTYSSVKNTVKNVTGGESKYAVCCSDCFCFLSNICVLRRCMFIQIVHKLVNPREGERADENCS